jgi:hypothetical protein
LSEKRVINPGGYIVVVIMYKYNDIDSGVNINENILFVICGYNRKINVEFTVNEFTSLLKKIVEDKKSIP